jgi:Tol biopolymer transport system component
LSLQPGTRVGGYEVAALIGAGGMGEVYRARDLRLGRDVAIKILSPQITADADALMRFEREARALASLNHPHIGGILGVEDHGAQPALILELVGGETLADRLHHGPIPIAEAVDYATQIADALDAAHEAGIVHRDLKPGNIKITDDGRIKILDFGLAKAIAAAGGESADIDPANSPTITVHGTKHGVILGTAAYMSPEQARGKRIDKRTDIWAFGCVLFEMLTGKRPFNGETTSDVIAAIIERTPDLSLLPPSTPPHIRRIVERCLEKDPRRRARDIADVRHDLDGVDAAPPSRRPAWLPIAAGSAIAAAALAVAAVSWRDAGSPASPPAAIEFTFTAPDGYTLVPARRALSPDGRQIAFVAENDRTPFLFVRSLDTPAVRRLDATDGVNGAAFWSPDGRSLAFLSNSTWRRISVDGGPAVTIMPNIIANLGGSWGPGDVFLVAPANRTSLVRVPISGGAPQQVTALDPEKENSHRWPRWLPDGRHFLFTARSDRPESLGIRVGALGSNEVKSLVNVASQGVYAEPGWLLFMTPDQVLMAQRIDQATWTLQGTAQPLAGPVRYNGPSFNGMFDASLDGRVLTYATAQLTGATLEWFDRTGKPLGRVGPERAYRSIRLSPDGKVVAVELADEQIGTRDLWMVDVATNAIQRVTANPATDWRPVFSPDSSSVAFASDRSGVSSVFRTRVDGAGAETALFRDQAGGAFPVDWSRDGKRLLVTVDNAAGRNRGLAQVPVDGGPPLIIGNTEGADFVQGRYAPSGDRIALVSRNAGGQEVHVMSLSDRQLVRVSTDGGFNPSWSHDGRELYFQNRRNEIMRAGIDGMTVTSTPQPLFQPCVGVNRAFSSPEAEVTYDVASDGRFLAICSPSDALPSAITVVVNWQSKLK